MANTDKEIVANVAIDTLLTHDISKNLAEAVNVVASVLHGMGKHVNSSITVSTLLLHGIGKHIIANSTIAANIKKSTGKNIVSNVALTGEALRSSVTLTMVYNGNAELGLGSQEGSWFNIIATGTFTTFTISMNGKSLTYTENCVAQTITIDNVNATVMNGTTNKLSKVTGDVGEFLSLIPGDNTVTINKTGGNIEFVFDFIPQFI